MSNEGNLPPQWLATVLFPDASRQPEVADGALIVNQDWKFRMTKADFRTSPLSLWRTCGVLTWT